MHSGALWYLADRLRDQYQSFLETAFSFRDPVLRRSFADALRGLELVREPYVELSPRYHRSNPPRALFRELLGQDVLSALLTALHGERPLYSHQEQALRRVWSGNNVVVATGTGSGKTEAFLLPILLSLYEEWCRGTLGPGVRALILYPMNALAFDQRARLAEIARVLKEEESPFHFTFGQYTGHTPEDERDKGRAAMDWEEERTPHTILENGRVVHGELVFRREMRATPPHILITNYSMLEYLLIRPTDSPLFDGEAARHWRFLVVDEVHTYSGVRGQELALLLRRLKVRLRQAGNRNRLFCIATSATLFTGQEAKQQAAQFAERLFGEPFSPDDIILGQRADLSEIFPREDLGELGEHVSRLTSALQGGPRPLDTVAHEVFPEEVERQRAEAQLLRLLSRLGERPGRDGQSLLSTLRLHIFVRGLEGAFVRYVPGLQVTLSDQSDESAKCFELALCRFCGQHYLVGQVSGDRFIAANRDYSSVGYRIDYLLPLDSDEVDRKPNIWLCPVCGALSKSARCSRGCEGETIPVYFEEEAHDRDSGELKYCLVCNVAASDPVRELVYGGEWVQAVIATTILDLLPKGRRKMLAFADGRQDAAYFAVRLDEWASQLALRRGIVQALKSLTNGEDRDGLSLRELHEDLLALLPQLFDDPAHRTHRERRKELWKLLLQELRSSEENGSLESAAIAFWRLGWPWFRGLPESILAKLLQLEYQRAVEVAEFLLLSLIRSDSLAIELLDPNTRLANDLPMNRRYVRIGSPDADKTVVSWDGVERGSPNRRVDYLVRFLRRQNPSLSVQEARAKAGEVLQSFWEWMRREEEGLREQDKILIRDPGKGFQLNPLWLRLARRDEQSFYRCDCCGRPSALLGAGPCPRYGCPGTLQPASPSKGESRFYRELYESFSGESRRFLVEEHTAQLTTQKAQEYQLRFSRGDLHVLSCSTTFELGVDLGDIDVVFLRNVPPEPFNYTQRAGRTGRRQQLGLVVTFCRRRPHDLYHFRFPERLLQGESHTMVPRHWSRRVIQRHVNAVVFSRFFRAFPERFRNVEAMVGERWDPGELCGQLGAFITAHFRDLLDEIQAVLRDCLDQDSPEVVNAEQLLAGVNESGGVLDRALAEICEDYRAVRGLEEQARNERRYKDADWAHRRAETIAREDVLSFLSRKAVIPKYGFPVDVVELTVPDSSKGVELTRDLRFAISEYAPGQSVIANKWKWESGGVKILPARALPRRRFRYCEQHRSYIERDYSDEAELPPLPCGCTGHKGQYVQPIFGFFVPRGSAEQARARPRQTLPLAFFVDLGESKPSHYDEYGAPAVIRVAAVERRPVVVLSQGVRAQGFKICLQCGTARDARSKQHLRRDGKECDGQFERVMLGHSFLTDVVRVDFLIPSSESDLVALNHGLVAVLVAGLSRALEVPVAELGGVPVFASGYPSVVLFDDVPAGGGLVARLKEKTVLEQVLRYAYEQVDGRCGCGPHGSCYSCLRTFANQAVHALLRRGLVFVYLEQVRKGLV
ncbi:DEAD/DEAH box helicase [Thermomicrobium sp. 4228-Ro]|uniref:DEAD/DEAH box helicase n=1 Tax=Thermomicrobium sp. 4228-Ro TaxID=2993937 RepID=UPI00224898AF|nr:DEAD/DEAH box helicase [Thermomicrobium sp. 4228-Ro]MCX2728187.1 DEAD/DEAH box helicase [Thermomicrobium sp. 4228-Ro]